MWLTSGINFKQIGIAVVVPATPKNVVSIKNAFSFDAALTVKDMKIYGSSGCVINRRFLLHIDVLL